MRTRYPRASASAALGRRPPGRDDADVFERLVSGSLDLKDPWLDVTRGQWRVRAESIRASAMASPFHVAAVTRQAALLGTERLDDQLGVERERVRAALEL